ncbi:hypothetical protein AB0D94_31080 [Streptomyces sp. NPDC048255]|uniref:hypothetical protein n=1 Tax=Streptomyces sp. NPDC048255 TaxID=3154713 RepID=UPI0033E234AF
MAHIEVWAADHTNSAGHERLIQDLWKISDYLSQGTLCIGRNPEPAEATGHEAPAILGLISVLVSSVMHVWRSEDQLLAQRTIGFDRAAIRALTARPGRLDGWRLHAGPAGRYELTLKWTGPGDTRLLTTTTTTTTGSTWSASTPAPPVTALGTPALAVHDGRLHCMAAGDVGQFPPGEDVLAHVGRRP